MITKQEIITLSKTYNHIHKVLDYDFQKANRLQKALENRNQVPTPGDIIICKGPTITYKNGHLNTEPENYSSICVQPYIPFISCNKDGEISFSTSGGYWLSTETEMLVYKGKQEKIFKSWGHCGGCGDGAFNFPATVNVWELFLESIY